MAPPPRIDREPALSYLVGNCEPDDITQTLATTVDLSQVAKLQVECDRIIQYAVPSIAIQYVEEGSYPRISVQTCVMLAKSGHCHFLLEQFEKIRRQNVSLSPTDAFEHSQTLLNNVASIHGIIESDLFLEIIQWLFLHVDSRGVEILVHSLKTLPIQAKSKIELLDQLRKIVLNSKQHDQCERCENYHTNWRLLISIDDLRFQLFLSTSQFEVLCELMDWYSPHIHQKKLGRDYVTASHSQWCSQFVSIALEKEKYKQAAEIANLFPQAAQFWIDNLTMEKVRLKGVVEAVSTIEDADQRNSIFLDLAKNGFAIWDYREGKSKIELLNQLRKIVLNSKQHNQCERCENYHTNWRLLISIDDLRFQLFLSTSQFEVLCELMDWYSLHIHQKKLGLDYVAASHSQWCRQFVSIALEKEKYKRAAEIANLFPRVAQFWIDNLKMEKVRLKGVVEAVSTIEDKDQRNSIFLDLAKNGFAIWDYREDNKLKLLNQLRDLLLYKIDNLDEKSYENEQLLLSIDDQRAKNLLSNSHFDSCFNLLNWYFNEINRFFHSLAPMIVKKHLYRWCTDCAVATTRSEAFGCAAKIGELVPYLDRFWIDLIRMGRVSLRDVIFVVYKMPSQSRGQVLYSLLWNGFPLWEIINKIFKIDNEPIQFRIDYLERLYINLIENRGSLTCPSRSDQNSQDSPSFIRRRRRRTGGECPIRRTDSSDSIYGFDQMLSCIQQASYEEESYYFSESWKLKNNENQTILDLLAIHGNIHTIKWAAYQKGFENLGNIDTSIDLARQKANHDVVEFLLEYKFDTLIGEKNAQNSKFSYRKWLLGLSLYFIQEQQYESALVIIGDMRPEDRLHAACIMKERLVPSAEQSTSIHALPPELLTECLTYVEPLMPVTNVCRNWRETVQGSSALRLKWRGEQKILGYLETLIENNWHEFARHYLTSRSNQRLDRKSLAMIHLPTIIGNLLSAEHYIWAKKCIEIHFFETEHYIRQEIIDEVCAHKNVCEDPGRTDWLLMRALELIPREDKELRRAFQQKWENLTDPAGKYTTFPLGSLSIDNLPPQNIDPEVSDLEACFCRLIELIQVDEGEAVIHLQTTLKHEFENTKSDWKEQGQVVAQRLRPMIKRWVLRLICHEHAHLAVQLVEFLEFDLIDRLIICLLMKSVLRYGRYRN